MQLVVIKKTPEENEEFINHPLCRETIYISIGFHQKMGYVFPWVGYYAELNGDLVGAAGFKGPPVNNTVEIAYGTFEPYRKKGIGTDICKCLVDLSLQTDPSVIITARTLPEENYSVRILKKNNFIFNGIINDPEDGEVWEWVYVNDK